eukprot:16439618-Heterocapsa_arctica.AAC.1
MATKLVVGLPKATTVDQLRDMVRKGALKRVSPEEPVNAFLAAIARDVKAGESEQKLKEWKRLALSTTIEFRALDSADDFHWAA